MDLIFICQLSLETDEMRYKKLINRKNTGFLRAELRESGRYSERVAESGTATYKRALERRQLCNINIYEPE